MRWLVVVSYGTEESLEALYRVFYSREEAMSFIDAQKLNDSCYCAELYEYVGCYHAVG